MMWSAVLPPENNPFMDDHLIYAQVLVVLALAAAGGPSASAGPGNASRSWLASAS